MIARAAIRSLRSRDAVAARVLGQAGPHSPAARSDGEDAEAARVPQGAGRDGERQSPDGEHPDRHPGSGARPRCGRPFPAARARSRNGWPTCRRRSSAATASLTLAPAEQTARRRISACSRWPRRRRGYWGEADYNSDDDNVLQFTEGRDQDAPLHFAASIEKGGSGDDRVQANSSRMVVVTQCDLRAGQRADAGSAGARFRLRQRELAAESRSSSSASRRRCRRRSRSPSTTTRCAICAG